MLVYKIQFMVVLMVITVNGNCIGDCVNAALAVQGYAPTKSVGRYFGDHTKALRKAGIPYKMRGYYKDYPFLHSSLKDGPVTILLNRDHAVLITGRIAGKGYRYKDPPRMHHTLFMSEKELDKTWTGGAIFIEPKPKLEKK